jgi:hypothetical protein
MAANFNFSEGATIKRRGDTGYKRDRRALKKKLHQIDKLIQQMRQKNTLKTLLHHSQHRSHDRCEFLLVISLDLQN